MGTPQSVQEQWREELLRVSSQLRELSRTSTLHSHEQFVAGVENYLELTNKLLAELEAARNENQALLSELGDMDRRLGTLERSLLFRGLRAVGLRVNIWERKAGRLLLRSPFHPLYRRLQGETSPYRDYQVWLGRHRASLPYRTPDETRLLNQQCRIRFSVLLPVHRPHVSWLKTAVSSVLRQTYQQWQLCICIDGEIAEDARAYLEDLAHADERVSLATSDGGGISNTLNRTLADARGDYVVLLDHDDLLEPAALANSADFLSQNPVEVLYTDEGYIDEKGRGVQPNFKPGWSPDLLLSCMYMGHMLVLSRESLDSIGGFRPACDGAQDYDAVLRLIDSGARVGHLPKVLYHWRRHPGSTASHAGAKPYTHDAGRRALAESLLRRGWTSSVSDGPRTNTYMLDEPSQPPPSCSIIIPTRSAELLRECLAAVRSASRDAETEIIVVHHIGEEQRPSTIPAVGSEFGARVLSYDGAFNFSEINNLAAREASGDLLVFLNDDVRPVNSDWLKRISLALSIGGVGVVGAKLLYPDGTIQHAGIVLGMSDGSGHAGRHLLNSAYWPWINNPRNVSAVTGACLGIRRRIFEELGGFDPNFPRNYNDVDLCLRAWEAGHRVMIENSAVLIHRESATRSGGTEASERILFRRKWGHKLRGVDRFFTPHLRSDIEDLSLPL